MFSKKQLIILGITLVMAAAQPGFDTDRMEYCAAHLSYLDPSYLNSSIQGSCHPWLDIENNQAYEIQIAYDETYWQDDECTEQFIFVGGQEMQQSWDFPCPLDCWCYDEVHNMNYINFYHWDIDRTETNPSPAYDCRTAEDSHYFIWICDIELEIWMDGYLQLAYLQEFTALLSKYTAGDMVVDIAPNYVVGECCENYLHIESTLYLCGDSYCNTHINPQDFLVERNYPFWVEHCIDSPEWHYMYMEVIAVQLNGISANVNFVDMDSPTCTIIELYCPIAMWGMYLEVVSQITNGNRRVLQEGETHGRMLQDITDDEEYKVKSGTSITVVDAGEREQMDAENGSPTDTSNNNEEQNTSKETEYKVIENSVRKEEKAKADNRVVIVSAVLGSLLFLTIAGIVVYCIVKKNEKPDPAEKYTVARRESLQGLSVGPDSQNENIQNK